MAQKKTLPSSISSAESEGLASDLNEPDLFGQLPSASRTVSAKQSLESTGPTPPSTMMSELSTQMDLETLISSAEVSPASLGVSPGSSEAQKMTVTSGRSWLPLLKTYGLDGSLGRMCEALLTNRWASDAAFLTWKASGIKPSHLLFQLAPSMPRTDETGSGLWLTPTTSESVADLEKFKTRMEKYNNGTTMPNLATQVNKRMWRTPNAGDGDRGTYRTKEAMDKRLKSGGQLSLPNQVKHPHLWPTPAACDYKGARSPEAIKTSGRNPLTNSLRDHVGATNPAEKGKLAGSLNPTWVEWLMGFPEGWTELKPSEMPSSRKSSRKSAKRSSRQRERE